MDKVNPRCFLFRRPKLSGVTLWSCCWSTDQKLRDRIVSVIHHCQRIIDFDRVVLFCCEPLPVAECELIEIKPLASIAQWNRFVNYYVPEHVNGEFAMSVHEDGFPLYPQLWSDRFLDYDYIGAPWGDGVVGNGGFNIESSRLMREKLKIPQGKCLQHPSDDWICKVHRLSLISKGISFAPPEVAVAFSTEGLGNERLSFGFHGRISCPRKYAEGWKIISGSIVA